MLRKAEYDSYSLVKVTYYIGSYFIWVVFAFGFPGNIASIFTILTMPTVSSSKVRKAQLTASGFGIYGQKAVGVRWPPRSRSVAWTSCWSSL